MGDAAEFLKTNFPNLPQFDGRVFKLGDAKYAKHQYQYATSSHVSEGEMNPGVIVYPAGDADIKKAIGYAKSQNIAIAVRTGGHQYSGASSTSPRNMQIDISETYRAPEDFKYDRSTDILTTSVSWHLIEFNSKLQEHQIFVPHGQCSHVMVGGHCQTGGYGQLGRSFGMFGDHIQAFRIFLADEAEPRWVERNKASDEDLFFAVLGGSPGNFGVITHLKIQPRHDENHPDSRGLKIVWFYNKDTLKNILNLMTEMSDDEDFSKDFDFCVTMLSFSQTVLEIFPGLDRAMHERNGLLDSLPVWPPLIIVYAQWANVDKAQKYGPKEEAWFKKIENAGAGWFSSRPLSTSVSPDKHVPMSKLTREWVFTNVREFNLPYEKRAYLTNSTKLRQNGWVKYVTKHIDDIQSGLFNIFNGCKLSVQIQPFGGKHSAFRSNPERLKTSYSWRDDTTLVCVLDCFYDPNISDSQKRALAWQAKNDRELTTSEGANYFGSERRVLWGSYGEKNLDLVWDKYFEDKQKYDRLIKIKRTFDPNNVFTPNEFCVGASQIMRAARKTVSASSVVSAALEWDDAHMCERKRFRKAYENLPPSHKPQPKVLQAAPPRSFKTLADQPALTMLAKKLEAPILNEIDDKVVVTPKEQPVPESFPVGTLLAGAALGALATFAFGYLKN